MITGMNHAVLYVRDARRHQQFYEDVLGFTTVIEDAEGAFVFLRAPASTNHHDLACFTIGEAAGPSTAGRQQVGLYHLAWEVPTLAALETYRVRLDGAGALVGASDHGANKSLYAKDPDGIEFEVMWLVPADEWGDEQHEAIVRPLDLGAELARFGADRVSTSHRIAGAESPTDAADAADAATGVTAARAIAGEQYCHFFDDAEFADTDRPGFRHRIITGDELQLCFWRIKGGAQGSFLHHHDEHEQLGIIMRGALDFRIGDPADGRRTVLRAGDVYLAPKTIEHGDSVFIGDDEYDECWILDVFAPPRDDLRVTSRVTDRTDENEVTS
jgi:catechol 2,3-dioxygenase-like lactoylglutathione lyase family enzyme/mannose-6-phosphate isomerase-like protein (cupin superfamily)